MPDRPTLAGEPSLAHLRRVRGADRREVASTDRGVRVTDRREVASTDCGVRRSDRWRGRPGDLCEDASAPRSAGRRGSAAAAAAATLFLAGMPAIADDAASREVPRLGRPVAPAVAAAQDRNVFPDGAGLPPGRGDAVTGARLFAEKCAQCHGPGGRGASAEELAGGTHALTAATPDKTIGSYWPYATTIFDFTRRAMPMDAPGSLGDDEVYALTAYLLFANGLIGEHDTLDARSLRRIRMPNRDGFFDDDERSR